MVSLQATANADPCSDVADDNHRYSYVTDHPFQSTQPCHVAEAEPAQVGIERLSDSEVPSTESESDNGMSSSDASGRESYISPIKPHHIPHRYSVPGP
jgi:hypothetical protein